jgi:hypothetical protein
MSSLRVDLFVEDRAHEEFLRALIERISREEKRDVALTFKSARGGRPRLDSELDLYVRVVASGAIPTPDILVLAIDANSSGPRSKADELRKRLGVALESRAIVACPNPHVERWYLADARSFAHLVGATPKLGKRKCERGRHKDILVSTILRGGNVPTLGGIELPRDLVDAMDFYQARKVARELGAFVDGTRSALRSTTASS